jgi:hypothetical protein
MQPPFHCQSCRRSTSEGELCYRKGDEFVRHDALLQCDVCERFACSECLEVYDILSGDDFLCHTCARVFRTQSRAGLRGH